MPGPTLTGMGPPQVRRGLHPSGPTSTQGASIGGVLSLTSSKGLVFEIPNDAIDADMVGALDGPNGLPRSI